jgi:protein ImuB
MLWACILLPRLALDSVLRRLPNPEKPLALVTGPANLRSLHAVNASAAEAGLSPGMRLSAAHALLADVTIVEYDTQAEARWHRFLAAWAYRHSSLVSAQWSGCVVLEASASFRLLGPWPRFEARLREELTALGFTHRIALAPTPRAACVLAGLRDGMAVTAAFAMQDVLANVPVRRAQLPDGLGERLHRMGVRDLQTLRALPRDSLRRRFGLELLTHLDRLYGEADDPRPERAWRRDDGRPGGKTALSPRPSWLLPHPVPLRGHLRILSGPERLESGWWDGGDARRDYYVLETAQGQRAWAFVPPGEQDGWMLHGWFA